MFVDLYGPEGAEWWARTDALRRELELPGTDTFESQARPGEVGVDRGGTY